MYLKNVSSLFLVSCISFSSVSCAFSPLSSPPTTIFSPNLLSFVSDASVSLGDLHAQSRITRYDYRLWDALFFFPDSIAGINLSFSNDSFSASYKGLDFSVPKSALPFQSSLLCMFDAIDCLDFSDNDFAASCSFKDGFIYYYGSVEQGDYTICFNSESGVLKSFEMPNMDLLIEFSSFSNDVVSSATSIAATEELIFEDNNGC